MQTMQCMSAELRKGNLVYASIFAWAPQHDRVFYYTPQHNMPSWMVTLSYITIEMILVNFLVNVQHSISRNYATYQKCIMFHWLKSCEYCVEHCLPIGLSLFSIRHFWRHYSSSHRCRMIPQYLLGWFECHYFSKLFFVKSQCPLSITTRNMYAMTNYIIGWVDVPTYLWKHPQD